MYSQMVLKQRFWFSKKKSGGDRSQFDHPCA